MPIESADKLIRFCAAKSMRLVTAESCTGGLVAAALTDVPGASAVLERGFITYADEAKCEMLGVDAALIDACGAVSEPVALAMAQGALAHSQADLAVAVTGIAGPGGGSPEKPVGLVYIAAAARGQAARCERHLFPGDRQAVRAASVDAALALLLNIACQA